MTTQHPQRIEDTAFTAEVKAVASSSLRIENERLTRENEQLRAALTSLRRQHDVCDDCWYTCPLALDEDGSSACCNNAKGFDRTRCTCGADQANAIIDAALGR